MPVTAGIGRSSARASLHSTEYKHHADMNSYIFWLRNIPT